MRCGHCFYNSDMNPPPALHKKFTAHKCDLWSSVNSCLQFILWGVTLYQAARLRAPYSRKQWGFRDTFIITRYNLIFLFSCSCNVSGSLTDTIHSWAPWTNVYTQSCTNSSKRKVTLSYSTGQTVLWSTWSTVLYSKLSTILTVVPIQTVPTVRSPPATDLHTVYPTE